MRKKKDSPGLVTVSGTLIMRIRWAKGKKKETKRENERKKKRPGASNGQRYPESENPMGKREEKRNKRREQAWS